FSMTSKRAGFVLSIDSSTSLYLILVANKNAVRPNTAQIRNNCVKERKPTNVSPSAGPNAKAKLPDNPKYPIPSPRRFGGIRSVAIVPDAVVEKPQPIP